MKLFKLKVIWWKNKIKIARFNKIRLYYNSLTQCLVRYLVYIYYLVMVSCYVPKFELFKIEKKFYITKYAIP